MGRPASTALPGQVRDPATDDPLVFAQVYEGEMLDEEKHGIGEFNYADGMVYTGEWHRGQRQGFGTLVAPDGSTYEGEQTVQGMMYRADKCTLLSC